MSYEVLIESSPVNQCVDMTVARISENYWRGQKLQNFYYIVSTLLLIFV